MQIKETEAIMAIAEQLKSLNLSHFSEDWELLRP